MGFVGSNKTKQLRRRIVGCHQGESGTMPNACMSDCSVGLSCCNDAGGEACVRTACVTVCDQ
jgi:hypothetical protein